MEKETLKIINQEDHFVPEVKCVIDYIFDLGEKASRYGYILSKSCAADILIGRVPKEFTRFADGSMLITWTDTKKRMVMMEIEKTHKYLVVGIKWDNNNYKLDMNAALHIVNLYRPGENIDVNNS